MEKPRGARLLHQLLVLYQRVALHKIRCVRQSGQKLLIHSSRNQLIKSFDETFFDSWVEAFVLIFAYD